MKTSDLVSDRARRERILKLSAPCTEPGHHGELRWPDDRERDLTISHLESTTSISLRSQLESHCSILQFGSQMLHLPEPQTLELPEIDRTLAASWSGSQDVAPSVSTTTLSPHRLSAHISVSTQLQMTSPAMRGALAEDQILSAIAAGIDGAALSGTGFGQPTGLLVDDDLLEHQQAGGSLALADLLEMESDIVSLRSAGPTRGLGWLLSADVAQACRGIDANGVPALHGHRMFGYDAVVVRGAPSDTCVFGRRESILVCVFGQMKLFRSADIAEAKEGFEVLIGSIYLDIAALDPERSLVRLTQPA